LEVAAASKFLEHVFATSFCPEEENRINFTAQIRDLLYLV